MQGQDWEFQRLLDAWPGASQKEPIEVKIPDWLILLVATAFCLAFIAGLILVSAALSNPY